MTPDLYWIIAATLFLVAVGVIAWVAEDVDAARNTTKRKVNEKC